MLMKKFLAVLVLALLPAFISLPSSAAENGFAVGSLPLEYVVGDPNQSGEYLTLEVFVSSAEPQRIYVEFVDFFSGQSGQRSQLPAGSTPYSLAKILEIEPFDNYHPGGGRQQLFEVVIRPKAQYERVLFTGGVVVRLEPVGDSGSGFGAASSILRSMTVTPYGLAASLAEGQLLPAKILRHDLKRLNRSSFIDSVIPDIPGVVNSGAVESSVIYENVGEYPVFAGVGWEFVHSGAVIASKTFRPVALAPGQVVTKTVTTEVSGTTENSMLNVLPGLGWVSNKISLKSSLGGTDLPTQTYDASFLVLQWKEPLVGFLGLYFLVRWAWRKNLSKRKKDESASLIWLALRGLARKRFPNGFGTKRPKAKDANLEVQLQGSSSDYRAPNRYDIKPARPYLVDSKETRPSRQDPPPNRF
jgi:hypothetical protein